MSEWVVRLIKCILPSYFPEGIAVSSTIQFTLFKHILLVGSTVIPLNYTGVLTFTEILLCMDSLPLRQAFGQNESFSVPKLDFELNWGFEFFGRCGIGNWFSDSGM